jgi:hypothetical protein
MNEECSRFMEDPDAHRDHVATCADCRAFLEEEASIARELAGASAEPLRPLAASVTSTLPLAPWEGAQHRAWGVAALGMIAVVALAAAAFLYGGVSPVAGFVSAARETLASQMSWIAVVRVLPRLLHQAPVPFHLFVAAGFIAANLTLYFLLRRSPKGYDAVTR